MEFQFSRCICLQTPEPEKLFRFYREVMGLAAVSDESGVMELKAGEFRMFVDAGQPMGPIMEFLVPDVEKARDELVRRGCAVIRWEGARKPCYIRDPFGFAFNLHPDKD